MREVRVALLEADVALPVVKDFIDRVREGAVGEKVVKSVTPGQMVVKIVHDELVRTLSAGETQEPGIEPRRAGAGADPDGRPAGLGQDHHHRQDRQAPHREAEQESADGVARRAPSGRPAAARRARRADHGARRCRSSPASRRSRSPSARCRWAASKAIDVVMLDTAGRLAIDEELMAEVAAVARRRQSA